MWHDSAMEFYAEHILEPTRRKRAIYREFGIGVEGSVPFKDWEVLAAILVGDRGDRRGVGPDLRFHEVKSAQMDGAFAYKYHRDSGLDKIRSEITLGHVWIGYSKLYEDVKVWLSPAGRIAPVLEAWVPAIEENCRSRSNREIRKSLGQNAVEDIADLVLLIRGGKRRYIPSFYNRTSNL